MIKQAKSSSQYIVLVGEFSVLEARSALTLALAVDNTTTKVLSSCCRMFDVMEAGVLGKPFAVAFLEEKLPFMAIVSVCSAAKSARRPRESGAACAVFHRAHSGALVRCSGAVAVFELTCAVTVRTRFAPWSRTLRPRRRLVLRASACVRCL